MDSPNHQYEFIEVTKDTYLIKISDSDLYVTPSNLEGRVNSAIILAEDRNTPEQPCTFYKLAPTRRLSHWTTSEKLPNPAPLHVFLVYLCQIMRFAYYILACYTLLLSCIPCQDGEFASFPGDRINVVATPTGTQDAAIIDLCSPFCICACCSGITLQHAIATLPDLAFFSFPDDKSVASAHRTDSGALTSVWQPPRI